MSIFLYNPPAAAVPDGGGTGGVTDHGDLTGLSGDDHTLYARADGLRTFPVDHGATGGLADDDHPQYARADGTRTFTGPITVNGNTVWHTGNDGAASGLDADLLDGQQGTYYATAAAVPAPTQTAPPVTSSSTSTTGTETAYARGDHRHGFTSGAPAASAIGDTAVQGSATALARSDHRHGREGASNLGCFPRSGDYWQYPTTAEGKPALGTLYFTPFVVPYPITVGELAIRRTLADGVAATQHAAIFNTDHSWGGPSQRLMHGTTTAVTAGATQLTSATGTLPAGLYWTASLVTGTTAPTMCLWQPKWDNLGIWSTASMVLTLADSVPVAMRMSGPTAIPATVTQTDISALTALAGFVVAVRRAP